MISLTKLTEKQIQRYMFHGSGTLAQCYNELVDAYEQQQQRIAELEATVERLRDIAFPYISLIPEVVDWFDNTPQQNINHVKRKVAKEAFKVGADWANSLQPIDPNVTISGSAEEYANQRYPSDKDGE